MSSKGMHTNGGHVDEAALSAYRDGELTAPERAKVDAHLADCERCRRVLRGYDLMASALRDQPLTVPSGLRGDLYARLGAPSHRFGWWPALASAATVAVAVYVATSLFGVSTIPETARAFPLPDATAVSLTTSVEIVYPAGVDREAVAAAVQIDPPVPVKKTWNGDKLVLTPEQPLKPDTTYSVRAPSAPAQRVSPPAPAAAASQTPTPAVITKFTTQPASVAAASATAAGPAVARSGSPTPKPLEQTPVSVTEAPTPPATPTLGATSPVQPTTEPVAPSPTGSAAVTTVRETATPTAKGPLTDLSAAAQRDQVRGRIGQPAGEPALVQVIEQTYENGTMLWRGDTRMVYVLLSDGKWTAVADTSTAGDAAPTTTPTPQVPDSKGRFKKILSERDDVNSQLGKAIGSEHTGQGAVQEFASGTLVATDHGLAYALFANHHWLGTGGIVQDGVATATPVAVGPTTAPSPTPSATATPTPSAGAVATPAACAVPVVRGFGQL